jgi:F-type H+-transporting ATPase subunit b
MKASLLDPHVGTIIWTLITFLLVLFVLKKWAWPPILSALDEREERIRSAIDDSEKARQEAEAVLSEHRSKLAAAEDEARQIIAEAREVGEKARNDIVEQAREEAQRAIDQARTSIEGEKRTAIAELRREMAELAVHAAGRLIDANLDDEKNRGLVDDLISKIPESN